jgi:hypothetical protein
MQPPAGPELAAVHAVRRRYAHQPTHWTPSDRTRGFDDLLAGTSCEHRRRRTLGSINRATRDQNPMIRIRRRCHRMATTW